MGYATPATRPGPDEASAAPTPPRPRRPRRASLGWGLAIALCAGPAMALDLVQVDWQFRYKDGAGQLHPVRLGQLATFDQEPDGSAFSRGIGPQGTSGPFPLILTGLDGRASAQLENFEPGGIDPIGRVSANSNRPPGATVVVTMNQRLAGDTKGANHEASSPAVLNVGGDVSVLPVLVAEPNTELGRAFAAYDALVTGKRYAEFLGSTPFTVDGVLATTAGTALRRAVPDNRIYQLNVGTAAQPDADAFDWDVLLHEVGHAVSRANGFNDSPGGTHTFAAVVAPKLAWAEGYSNFFQAAAQRWEDGLAGDARLPDVRVGGGPQTIRDRILQYDDTRDSTSTWNIEERGSLQDSGASRAESGGFGNELVVARVLWDLLDGTAAAPEPDGTVDQITTGHQALFDRIKASAATTLQAFKDFLDNTITSALERTRIGAIFAAHSAAPRALGASPPASAPPTPAPPAPTAASTGPGRVDAQGSERTPAKEAGVPPYVLPDLAPDVGIPVFRAGDPPPLLRWRAPWGSGRLSEERYRLQFFRTGTAPAQPDSWVDTRPDSDWQDAPELTLVGSYQPTHVDNCGTASDLEGLRCAELDPGFWRELARLQADQRLLWNVVGLSDTPEGTLSNWGSALAFDLHAMPEPGALALVGLACAGLAAARRRR